ncbi:hypothetical protein F9L33_13035 [Amylibacter sp. SFDW26]|uniref:hypothetical protein n=1 Tax=Amylibacter sp. SFDW26 TaxID=2652722 RepID=UPI001261EA4D|nr:hypothetical protein [Amylibacter sp. SFDW26]KAB7613509.1 hypothetical protein F9L33_13035 [Amylibacter sp. SFDW26]
MSKPYQLPTILSFISVLLLCSYMLGDGQLNHDTSWYLISTGWWLEGVRIYDEILELNPPLAYYLTVPPVYVSQVFNWNAVTVMKVYVLVIATISVLWAHFILTRNQLHSSAQVAALTIGASFALMIVPIHNFAQREHLMVLFAWPYVALSLSKPMHVDLPQKHIIAIGLFAALGFAIKPYFLAIPLCITMAHCVYARSLRPIASTLNVTVLVFCILYVLASLFLHPEYFNNIIPQTVLTYGAYEEGFLIVIRKGASVISLMIFALLVAFLLPSIKKSSFSASVCAAACLGGLGSYLIQSKGWGYQIIPFQSFAFIFLAWLTISLFEDIKTRLYGFLIGTASLALILVPALKNGTYENPFYKQFAQHFSCPAGARSYQVFGSNVSPSFPLANFANATPANRAPGLWIFPGVIHQLENVTDDTERMALNAAIEQSRKTVVDDFMRVHPQLIIVDVRDHKSYFQGSSFDYIDYFKGDERFKLAWVKYKLVDEFQGFQTYRRKGCVNELS